MDKRYLKVTGMTKATVAILGTIAGVTMIGASPANAWTDDNGAGASSCTDPVVNDAGTVAGTCEVNNARRGFVKLPTGSSTFLAGLPSEQGGVPCIVAGLSNAAAGSEIIPGACADQDFVMQGVYWNSSTPTTAPTLLKPLSLLGLLADVQTVVTAFNTPGTIVGVSIGAQGSTSGQGNKTPVSWSSSGAPTQLAAPLGSMNNGCVPADVNDASTPSIIGNCADAGTGGGSKAVLWQGTGAAYSVLPVPSGADYCTVSKINLSGQILGQCNYGTDTYRAAVWGPGGTAPLVLLTVASGSALRTAGVDISDSGIVACNYLAGGASAGFSEPCVWNPANGNTNATLITLPGGATTAATNVWIANNGTIVGDYKTAAGVVHPYHVPSGSTTAVDDGTPGGGPNTVATWISKGGLFEVVTSEDATGHWHDEVQSLR
ncbi:hypothetical protein [Bradyrhizobium jicamae]|uniref:hypothetical protein n=1 Tax=Bradyrhizobium jicamae TaxID=280332 RepID=UPI001BA53D56|nr:hypothetical protein [Bradyrhizobium jicamae]MBR0934492.1 hypothetical protein [Bradyrhizobium jicamae]